MNNSAEDESERSVINVKLLHLKWGWYLKFPHYHSKRKYPTTSCDI